MPAAIFHSHADPKTRALSELLANYLCTLEPHAQTRWFYPVPQCPLGISAGEEADAFISRLFKHLSTEYSVEGYSASGVTYEKIDVKAQMVWTANSDSLKSKFSIVHFKDHLYAFVSGETGAPAKDLEPWLSSIDAALKQGKEHPIQAWIAVVGMVRAGIPSVEPPASWKLDGIDFRRADFSYDEKMPHPLSISAFTVERWQPFIVSGATKGHSWNSVQFSVQEDLHLACALLSVHTNQVFKLRQMAVPGDQASWLLPSSNHALTQVDVGVWPQDAAEDAERIGDWWSTCVKRPDIVRVVRAYYEALTLVSHPSFALIGFVGVIEEVGALLFEDEPQPKCDGCGKPMRSSSAARFRKALSLVLPVDRVKPVSDRLYKWRSGTAHSGRTFATETSFGLPQLSESMLVPNASSLFLARGTSHAQEIARDLIVHLLAERATCGVPR